MDHQHCASLIEQDLEAIAAEMVTRHYQRHPEIAARYGDAGCEKCLQDARYHLTYLIQAIRGNSQSLFNDYIDWVLTLFEGLHIPAEDLRDNLLLTAEILRERLPRTEAQLAGLFVDKAVERFGDHQAVPSFILEDAPLGILARSYLDLLLAGRRHDASQLILDAVTGNTPVADIYLHVFQTTQREVGRLWQTGAISVGQEHYCTAATQMVMSQLYPYVFSASRCGRSMVATCVGGELHEIGVRMVTDFFEMAGWDTYYLGANVPIDSVLEALRSHQAAVLGLSVTLSTHLGQARNLIDAVRGDDALSDVKILVGGYPFNVEPDLWRDVGADGFGPDAATSVAIIEQLLNTDGNA